jgi:hypothetical protein
MFASSIIDGEKRGEGEKQRICAQPHFIKHTPSPADTVAPEDTSAPIP